MNWRLKILAKIVLSRLPFGYRTFRRLGVFRHGYMRDADYALGVVTNHAARLGGADRLKDAVCIEIGPGDSLASAIIAHGLGARMIYLVDAGDFAEKDMGVYRRLARQLSENGLRVADLESVPSVNAMLDRLGAVYLTDGLEALRTIPSACVDLIWSQAVLEHVRRGEMDAFLLELRRVIKPSGGMSHRIDFMDHLGGSANNLRFPMWIWESRFMASSGFYTNRIRCSEMVRRIEGAGFEVNSLEAGKWAEMPVPRSRLAVPFAQLSEDDLLTKHVDLVALPAAQAAPC
jgi:hypothetical protein